MKERRRERLHSRLRLATATIKDNPTTFFEHKDFLALTDMLSDMSSSAAIRMKVSIPASYLHNTEKLNSLPLPVTIEKATRYIEGSGANIGDEIVVFDWFSMGRCAGQGNSEFDW